jgi:uncharacterized protein (DUF433 family)
MKKWAATFSNVAASVTYPHIVKRAGESARLEKHPRTRVAMIADDYLWRGWSAEEIVRQYPYLTLGEAHAALAYFHDNRDEIESELVAEYRESEDWKKNNATAPLLVRLKGSKRTGGELNGVGLCRARIPKLE